MIELACAVEKINNKKLAYHFNTYGPRAPHVVRQTASKEEAKSHEVSGS